MGRVATGVEKAHLMLARAQRIRTIADGLPEEHHRSLLHTIANEFEQQAKQIACRVERNLKQEFNREIETDQARS